MNRNEEVIKEIRYDEKGLVPAVIQDADTGEVMWNGRLEQYEWEQLEYKIKSLIEAPIYIDDSYDNSVLSINSL